MNRQELSLGNAEDAANVVSVTATASVPGRSCAGNCMMAREFTPIDPANEAHEYYAPGIGMILAVDMEGNRLELVEKISP